MGPGALGQTMRQAGSMTSAGVGSAIWIGDALAQREKASQDRTSESIRTD